MDRTLWTVPYGPYLMDRTLWTVPYGPYLMAMIIFILCLPLPFGSL